MVKSRIFLMLFVVLMILQFYFSVFSQDNTPIVITPLPTVDDPLPFPDSLYCAYAPSGQGPSWNGITIGTSTVEDLKQLMFGLSDNYIIHVDEGVWTRIEFLQDWTIESSEDNVPSYVGACTQDGIIVTLSINIIVGYEVSSFLDDWVLQLGPPDVVTWGSSSFDRTVMWFEEGITVSTFIGNPNYGAIFSVIYYPFQSAENYKERWPFLYTRKSAVPHHLGDNIPSMEQNPFDFDAIIATITAQPPRTPTPTFVPYPIATSTPRP
jgi:hypothetical protein